MLNKREDEKQDKARMKGMTAKGKAVYQKKDKAMDSLPGMTAKMDERLDKALEADLKVKFGKTKLQPKKTAEKKPAKKAAPKK